MPETLDLLIPNKEGEASPYRLEILYNNGASRLSLYHCFVKTKKLSPGNNVELIRTGVYCFEYKSGKLIEFYSHRGDFTELDFRWADTQELEFKGEEITENHRLQALGRISRVRGALKSEKARTVKEQDKYGRFLSPLEKIIDSKAKGEPSSAF